jgi:ATP-dependent DNA helicase RecG
VPATAFLRLSRVLDLEQRQGWRNRAVIGGLGAMAERWQEEAAAEASDRQIVAAAVALMARYDAASPMARPDIAEAIRQVLRGEVVDLPDESDEADAPDAEEASAADIEPEAERMAELATLPPPEPTHVARERAKRRQGPPRDLAAPVTVLSGVGTTTAEQLARLGINQVQDLLWHLPARHEDYSQLRTIAQLRRGEHVTVIANLWEIRDRKISMNRQMVQGILADGTGTLHATWWNKYVRNQLKTGETMRFSGKVGLYMGQLTLDNPAFEDVDEEMVATGRLTPIYPLTEGISNKKLRSVVKSALDEYADLVEDALPESLRDEYALPGIAEALRAAHFPDSHEQLQAGLRRLAFEEFLCVQLGALQRRQTLKSAEATALPSTPALVDRFRGALPFAMTGAQERVLGEILRDLDRTVPMTRMVQGDVGSGKTALAAAAMFVAAASGAQSALLAPTQILAEQHHRSIEKLFAGQTKPDGAPLRLALLTGRVTGQEREDILQGLQTGTIDIVAGTTALIQESVEFANLGFVVVDEQHRFGVEQRGALRGKGMQPHLLVMSATPIPRSLALTIYGELDVSVVDEMPPGRTPVKTKWFRPPERERLYNFLRKEAREGKQAFIVYPLVEESEKLDAGAAVDAAERLDAEVFPDLRVGLLHGRMTGKEKDVVMSAFAAGDYDVLVSTSVIEVGIDVPNATLMIIEDAERFGLAQLHQLRGRVGRGEHKSYCALVSDAAASDAEERLHVLESTNSGFELAEKDLELRGPGDFLGTRQSGLPEMRVAQLSDMATLSAARAAAQALLAADPNLDEHPLLAQRVEKFWRGHGDVS